MKARSLFLASLLTSSALSYEDLTPEKAAADIQEDGLRDVLENLDRIARENGGNRAFGFPGYNASLDFVLGRVIGQFGEYFDTTVQPFNYTFSTTYHISVRGPDGELKNISSVENNNPTPLPGGVTGNLVALPIDDKRGSGCFEDQWKGFNVDGKIALVKRGGCPLGHKLKIAKSKGVVGVLAINNAPGPNIQSGSLDDEDYGGLAPVAILTQEQGLDWKKQLDANKTIEATLVVDSTVEDRETWQIISETKEGDPDNVVMIGAHLDSVQMGPGIDDDGSGTATVLELASTLTKYTGYTNKIRLAWWGAEESGMIGSSYYVSQLSSDEADKIRFYINVDMTASPHPFFHVYADDDDDKTGGHLLLDYLIKQGYPAEHFSGDSDFVGFVEAGIPSSGLFTGAGYPYDVCYHKACDDINNINWDAITINAKAAAYVVSRLALSLDGIPPRDSSSANPSSKRTVARNLAKWKRMAKGHGKKHSCSGDKKNTF
ncbi:hypothetical protein NM208_g2595 [Fusarium decemcellulare]|uniref:Uncharacterized protein n=2 Tax=Fusarium decemcellulare TaxID=57161 RepID=A0ACC1SSK8_9HYPO|nr:hypothetical protein NM208_g4463 [Fusarium decemcellulare]KAJ3545272.1 hypothetical protein NM208_g2595 [Fusarium decemcellulare]